MIEITSASSTPDLTTEDRVLDGWLAAPSDTSGVPAAITSASRLVALWCRREFCSQSYEETLPAPGRMKLVLSERPVTAVATVTNDGDAVTEYKIYEQSGILYKTDKYPWIGPIALGGMLGRSVMVTDIEPVLVVNYTAGYITRAMDVDNFNLPAEIEGATIEIAREIIKRDRGEAVGDITRNKTGNFDVEYGLHDTMTGAASGYWADAIGDPAYLWIPLVARRALMHHRRMLI